MPKGHQTLPKKEALSPDEVAAVLGVCPRTVYRLLKRGHLPGMRVGDGPRGEIRIAVVDLVAFRRRRRLLQEVREG